jgi:serine phosphatase RsbU (regulator of sigma subunit)
MLDGMDAHAALDRLNRILLRSHPEMSATVCVLTFPPDRGTVTVDNAGHLPPLVVRADGAGYLEPGGVLLGVDGGVRRPATLTLAPGDRIVLMTDGLVERRGGSLTEALDALAEQVRSTSAGAEELSDLLMGRWGDSEDDICLIVLDLLPRVVLTAP